MIVQALAQAGFEIIGSYFSNGGRDVLQHPV
jgi:hypothetical protein